MRIPLSITLESFRLAIVKQTKPVSLSSKLLVTRICRPGSMRFVSLSGPSTVEQSIRIFSEADFSNYGKEVTVSAPGVDIKGGSANPDGTYGVMSGTSVAAAHVASVIALMKAKNPKPHL